MKHLILIIIIVLFTQAAESRAQQTGAQQTERERRNRSITGRVVNDAGQPIPHVTVYVNKIGGRQGPPSSTTGTDEQGNFQAEDLAEGAYIVNASVPGYVTASDEPSPRYYRVGDSVTLQMIKGGVITGAVTNSSGEPVVAAHVRAIRVREADGRVIRTVAFANERATDDRGIYRLYGLRSGTYLIAVTGRSMYNFGGPPSLYEGNAPTYYPSSTRDTAAEVTVRAGDEVTGIDIRYRGERGHGVSGTITGTIEGGPQQMGATVTLTHVSNGMVEAQEYVQFRDRSRAFGFYGVPDGEYELSASSGMHPNIMGSSPRRVTIKGGDATGIELALAPLGSIAGNIIIESLKEGDRKPECVDKRPPSVEEIVVTLRRDEGAGKDNPRLPSRPDSSPNDKGEFIISNLRSGLFRVQPRLPGDTWYVRSINLISPGKSKAVTKDVARSGIQLNQGDRVTGLIITISEGAASVTGKLVSAKEGQQLPSNIHIHLVPAEPEAIDDALRYRQTVVANDASFTLSNLAPGRYFILAKEAAETSLVEEGSRPSAWDATARAALRKEAEAGKQTIELQPCLRMSDYSLRFDPPAVKPAVKKQ